MTGPGGRQSVRVRILAAVLLATGLGMLVAGTVSYLLAREATHEGVRQALAQENEEIKQVAATVEGGQSDVQVRTPRDLLRLAISRSVPDPNEAIIGLVDGRVALVPTSDDPFQLSLAGDPELVAAAAVVRPGEPVFVHTIRTAQHREIAFVSIPIQVRGSTELGHFVAAVDVEAAMNPVNRTHLTFAAICLIALGVVAVVGHLVAGRLLAPLRSLQLTAQKISETDLTDRIPADQLAGRDEVADLGRTMNAMLDRLSDSFDNQRQMLDDAGHELRTPITIVRGHLELVDVDDPVDVRATRDLALDELDRMQRMVEELMVLAKSRRPDFVVRRPVVVADLLDDVLTKVRPLGDRDWQIDHTVIDTISLDPQRITQALLQLVANALRFTEPGALIALAAHRVDSTLRLSVRDDGAGIAIEQQGRVFERFQQLDQREQGAGLGLAIVSAITVAHGGEVELVSASGQGSTFTLILPVIDDVAEPDQQEEKE